ncbi:zinc-binding protein A33-like [Narcine bancroftii]|uniref:zinc-binding protein A33-like n=1 Tax=Narcine bancroftii TaxID=1343680 RepID=UPI0038311A92
MAEGKKPSLCRWELVLKLLLVPVTILFLLCTHGFTQEEQTLKLVIDTCLQTFSARSSLPPVLFTPKLQILKKVKDLKKIHDKLKINTDHVPLSLKDVERIVSKTKTSVMEKYIGINELLENDMKTTISFIEAEARLMENMIMVQCVDNEEYKNAISSIMTLAADINDDNIQTLQEFMSWKICLEAIEDLQMLFGKELSVENRKLRFLERSVGELHQAVKKLIPRIWEFQRNITFNENTAHRNLVISREPTSVQYSSTFITLQDNSESFENSSNILANESFASGKHYWEMSFKNKTGGNIGVTYSSISRKGKGKETTLGKNKHSWSIWLVDKEFYAFHADESISLNLNNADQNCERLGIFLDYEEGRLSFYNIYQGTHIHSFKTKFRKPVFPAFSPVSSRDLKDDEPNYVDPLLLKSRKFPTQTAQNYKKMSCN